MEEETNHEQKAKFSRVWPFSFITNLKQHIISSFKQKETGWGNSLSKKFVFNRYQSHIFNGNVHVPQTRPFLLAPVHWVWWILEMYICHMPQ
ncbi:MAG: hypothetical protein ACI8QD_002636 [Cyclobacteriaceae bacterium]|jgi:hypothetical protein